MKTRRIRAFVAAFALLLAAQAAPARFGAGGRPPQREAKDEKNSGRPAQAGARKSEDELVAEAFAQTIREALRKPQKGETRVRATLARVECGKKGLVFVLKAGERTLRLTAAGFEGLHIIAFTPEAGSELSCGAFKQEPAVVATYRAGADRRSKTDGPLVALEFVPADFQLKPGLAPSAPPARFRPRAPRVL